MAHYKSIRNNAILAGAALCLLAQGCSVFKKTETPAATINRQTDVVETKTPEQTVAAIDRVLYGEWTIANVGGMEVTGEERPYLIFDTTAVNPFEMKLYVNDGCNYLNGRVAVTPKGDIRPVNDFLSTMRYCADAKYELGIGTALNSMAHFKIEKISNDYILYLKNASDSTSMTMRKSDLTFLNGAWRVSVLDGKNIPADAEMQMVIDLPELKVHGNTGCNILNGSIFVDPAKQNSLQFSNLATTRMACPDMEREQKFLVVLEQVENGHPRQGQGHRSAQGRSWTGDDATDQTQSAEAIKAQHSDHKVCAVICTIKSKRHCSPYSDHTNHSYISLKRITHN